MRALLVACAIAGCAGPAPVAAVVANSPAPIATLEAQLIAEIGAGQPVAIVGGASVRAVSADGKRSRVLANVAAPWVLVDHRAQVIWFGTEGLHGIGEIDLEAAAPDVAIVVTGIGKLTETPMFEAKKGSVGFRFAIAHGDEADPLHYDVLAFPHIALRVTADPSIAVIGTGDTVGLTADYLGAAKLDRAKLVALAARHPDRKSFERGHGAKHHVDGFDDMCLGEAGICGVAEEVPHTRLWIVTRMRLCGFDLGHGCPSGTNLYNPDTRTFHGEAWTGVLDDTWLSPDGSTFIVGDQLVRSNRTSLTGTPDANASGGGWLGDGSLYYGH